MQEKPHVLHILNLLKDLLTSAPSASDPAPRLPAYTTLLLAHALRALFYPSNFIYPLTARFLLQRPALDATDVPMLFGMLYSASDDWKKERAWIVRFLADGIAGADEWRILKRRHTWDLLASLVQSESRDRTLRRGVLEVSRSDLDQIGARADGRWELGAGERHVQCARDGVVAPPARTARVDRDAAADDAR